jgi:hypothetical protein
MMVEKPPHVDHARMLHISDADLLDAVNPGHVTAGASVDGAGRGALAGLRAHFDSDARPAPPLDAVRWARRMAGDPVSDATVVQADALFGQVVDFANPGHGRSGLYGFHYLGWLDPLVRGRPRPRAAK